MAVEMTQVLFSHSPAAIRFTVTKHLNILQWSQLKCKIQL